MIKSPIDQSNDACEASVLLLRDYSSFLRLFLVHLEENTVNTAIYPLTIKQIGVSKQSMEKYQKNITENVLEKASLAGGSSSSNQKAMDLGEHRRSAMDSASTMTTNTMTTNNNN